MHARQKAQSRSLDVVKSTDDKRPQETTMPGRPTGVEQPQAGNGLLLPDADADESLLAFMRRSPLAQEDGLDFPREDSLTREVHF